MSTADTNKLFAALYPIQEHLGGFVFSQNLGDPFSLCLELVQGQGQACQFYFRVGERNKLAVVRSWEYMGVKGVGIQLEHLHLPGWWEPEHCLSGTPAPQASGKAIFGNEPS
jgi:hypothetical protein